MNTPTNPVADVIAADWQAISDATAYAPEDIRDAARLAYYRLAQPQPVTDAQVESVGKALYVYWGKVNEAALTAYRKKVRSALEAAFNG